MVVSRLKCSFQKSVVSSEFYRAPNNNPQGSAPSPFRRPGSVPGGFAQSHMATNFQAPFQFSQAQAQSKSPWSNESSGTSRQ